MSKEKMGEPRIGFCFEKENSGHVMTRAGSINQNLLGVNKLGLSVMEYGGSSELH